MTVVFSTCWYVFKAKFDPTVYQRWIDNMLQNVNNYYLVIYTDQNGLPFLQAYTANSRIRIVIKPPEEFWQYRHKDNWIRNHSLNHELNTKCSWEVNMLWSEKIHFVRETIRNGFFMEQADWYGWCDIGYFRPNERNLTSTELKFWPNQQKLALLDTSKIHYALVNPYIGPLLQAVQDKNEYGLPRQPIPPNQISIAGGFFLTTKENLDWWAQTFDARLDLYFQHGYLVKDDQMIIIDCIFNEHNRFKLHREDDPKYDNWFMFQRILL